MNLNRNKIGRLIGELLPDQAPLTYGLNPITFSNFKLKK